MSDDYATLARIEDHLRRIADALERPRTDRLPELLDIAQRGLDRVAASFRLAGSPDESRLAMQDLAMELRAALDDDEPDPLDEDDHRPRHDRDGDCWTWRWADRWCSSDCDCVGIWRMADVASLYGPLTFCDCDDATIEAENGATD